MTTEITFVNTTPLTVEVLWLNGEGGETPYAKLSPFEQYTQSTYEGHRWIIRDAVSGLRLDEVTAIATPLTFTPKVAVRSETADVSVTLHVHNTTTLAVGVYWLDYAGAPQLYAKLRPGERFSQSTYAGHPWCFRSLHCGTDLGLYIPSDAAEQTAEVTLRSRVSTTPVQAAFVNRTHLSLTVEWIDYGGETTVYGIIAPGERFEQATFVSHPWVLRDAYSGTVVRVVPSLTSDAEVVVDAEKLVSMAGTKVTEATMRNLLPFAIDLCWVDFNGSEQHYAELAPGAAYSVTTAAAHPWRARRKGGGPVAGLFIPGPEARQSKTFTATAIDGVQLAELEIANETRLTLDVLALDEGGAPYPLQRLGYKERFRLTMAEGAALVARDVASGHEIRAFKARAGAHVVELGPNDLRSAPGTKPVTVAFRNETPFEIEVFWIDFHKKERRYATLRPGQSYEQQTLIHHVWRARDAHTKALVGVYVASEADRQDAAFRVRSYTSTTPTGIRFVNSSMLAVDVIWLDFEGREKHYQTLEPGGSVGFNTYVTHPWIVRDRQSRRLLDWAWGDGTNQVVTIDERDIRPREGSNPVTLTFVNRLPWTVDVFWLDYAGKEQLYATVAPGQSHVQQTFETHPWRIRQQHSGDEVALYIASAEAKQTCSIALRSIHSDVPTSIKFMNLSPLQLGVFWIDYDGNEVRYATIASRESFEQQTFMTHPWIVRDMASMEAVAFTVGVRQPQELRVSAAATRSRPHGSPVDLTLVNGSGHRVDVNWIDFAGEEQTYATLDPNQSFQVKTGLHNTWRMREATSKSELDLYIAGSAAQQTYRITNKLVRTRERANAELWPGEVALYEHENFKGKVWILHQDTPDFRRIEGLNDTVSSVRVGPDTAATFFRDVGFKGINDVFHLDTVALRDSDVGNDRLSSLQILLTPQQAAASIQSTSRLSEEPSAKGDRIDNRAVLRTVVSLPPMTGSVDVWATEEVTIRAGGGSTPSIPSSRHGSSRMPPAS